MHVWIVVAVPKCLLYTKLEKEKHQLLELEWHVYLVATIFLDKLNYRKEKRRNPTAVYHHYNCGL